MCWVACCSTALLKDLLNDQNAWYPRRTKHLAEISSPLFYHFSPAQCKGFVYPYCERWSMASHAALHQQRVVQCSWIVHWRLSSSDLHRLLIGISVGFSITEAER
jgi:hypothetical protein